MSLSSPTIAAIQEDVLECRWRVKVGNRIYGPYTGHHMLRYIAEGRIVPYSLVKPVEGGEWRQASADEVLSVLLKSTPRSAPDETGRTPKPELKPRSAALCQLLNDREAKGTPSKSVPMRASAQFIIEDDAAESDIDASGASDAVLTMPELHTPIEASEPATAPAQPQPQPQAPRPDHDFVPPPDRRFVRRRPRRTGPQSASYPEMIGELVDVEAIEAMTVHALRHVLADPLDPEAPDASQSAGTPVTPLVIVANLQTSTPAQFKAAVDLIGTALEVRQGIWMLNAALTPAKVRNHLIRCLGADDEIYVIDQKSGRIAWFNLAPESDLQPATGETKEAIYE